VSTPLGLNRIEAILRSTGYVTKGQAATCSILIAKNKLACPQCHGTEHCGPPNFVECPQCRGKGHVE